MDASQAFAAVSEAYARYRPTYPPALFTAILDHNPALGRGGRRACAVDVACGSGQASLPLAELFERVVALDSCEAQLAAAKTRLQRAASTAAAAAADAANNSARPAAAAAAAPAPATPPPPPHARIELVAADAHNTGLPDACADLVAVAQALHWLDVPAFAREAARLLRPHGSLAAWSYGLATVASVAGGGGRHEHASGAGAGAMSDGDDEQDDEQAQEQELEQQPPPQRQRPPPPPSAGAGAAEAADAAVRRLYASLEAFWDERRLHVDDAYARLAPLLGGGAAGEEGGQRGGGGAPLLQAAGPFGRVERRRLEMRAWRGVDELVGYVASWSGVERMREARRQRLQKQDKQDEEGEGEQEEEEDPVARFRRELVAALGGAEDASLELVTPVTLVLASEPRRA